MAERATFRVKTGLAEMLKGGVIMDVVTPDQARIAEDSGACAVMALERVPADIRRDGGVARMSDPAMIKGIQEAVTIPVMAKARIGHFAEAQVLQSLEVDYIDESEVLTPADERYHIDKLAFEVPFVCGATNLGEALRRIGEGAAMIRSKGEAGTGNVVEAVRHMREITSGIKRLAQLGREELAGAAKEHQAPLEVVHEVAERGRLPVPLFCAGGIATPADAALMMQLGAEGNFVGSGIFKSGDPERRPRRSSRRPRTSTTPSAWLQPRSGSARRCRGSRSPSSLPPTRCSRTAVPELRLGVLAIQGGFEAHCEVLRELGAEVREVRASGRSGRPRRSRNSGRREHDDLDGDRGGRTGRADSGPARRRRHGLRHLRRDDRLRREHLGLIDATAARNAFGRQLQSFEADLEIEGIGDEPLRAVFIRAPWVERCGAAVEVLATYEGHPVAIRERRRARLRLSSRADRRFADARTFHGHDYERSRAGAEEAET